MRTRIKICCIQSADEARLAFAAGADAIGLVSEMPSGPGPIPESRIRTVISAFPDGVSVLLSSRTSSDAICEQVSHCLPASLQLVDHVSPEIREKVKAEFPDLAIIQVVHVKCEEAGGALAEAVPCADMLLLDSGNPGAVTGRQLGGTGRVHDWSLSARIIRNCPIPVWLAGGLTPGNVGKAIGLARPFGVDVCSGLRPNGALDPEILERFVSSVREANDVRQDH
ncbi:MAG: hypothetical protein OXF56_26630 [Rhodobacteraceae bacterium]|nr:hypothetical protein [Paracoccaceae bacterium]